MNFGKMIDDEETHLGIKLGNKERLLVEDLLRDLLVASIKASEPLEAKIGELEKKWFQSNKERAYFEKKLKIAVEALEHLILEMEFDLVSREGLLKFISDREMVAKQALAAINREGV